jgi:hypothetical protein
MAISGTYTAGDAISFGDCYVAVDLTPAASSYATIDSWSTEIQVSGEEVPTTQTYPFSGNAIVFTGVKGPAEVRCTIVYTQDTTDPYYAIRTLFASASGPACDIKFAPAGSGTGNLLFTTSGGKLISAPVPSGAGDANSPNVVTFVIRADGISMSIM